MKTKDTIRGAAMIAIIAGTACTETIDVKIQAVEIGAPGGPNPGMARVAITRIEAPRDELRVLEEMCKVKLDGNYLVHPAQGDVGQRFVRTQDRFTTLIDISAGEHTIELEHAPGGAAGLGDTHGDIAASVPVTLTEGSFNELVVYGAIGAEQTKLFLDELRGVPGGSYRARVMNLLDNPGDITVLACTTYDSCTTIKSGLHWGEVWEDVVDIGIRGDAVRSGSTQLLPLLRKTEEPLTPAKTPAFLSTYAWHVSSSDRSSASCPYPECNADAILVGNDTWIPDGL